MSAVAKQPYYVVRPVADRIVELLRPYCHRIEVAGSLRREAAMVGDIEICAIPRRFVDLLGQEVEERPTELDRFLDIHEVTFMKRGARYQRFKYGRFEVDLFLPNGATWGSIFTIRTGGWEFSRWLVLSRAAGGAKPPEIAFIDGRVYANGRLLATSEERDVFDALGLKYIDPRDRGAGRPQHPEWVEPVWRYEE